MITKSDTAHRVLDKITRITAEVRAREILGQSHSVRLVHPRRTIRSPDTRG